jgi:hypothetical protein
LEGKAKKPKTLESTKNIQCSEKTAQQFLGCRKDAQLHERDFRHAA